MIRPGIEEGCSENTTPHPMANYHSSRSKRIRRLKLLVVVLMIIGGIICLCFVRIGKIVKAISEWIQGHVLLGALAMLGMFLVSILVGIPSTILEALAGYFFGWGGSIIVSTIGKCSGCIITFLLGRYFLADAVAIWMQKYKIVRALSMVFASESSWQLLFCVQLSYLPLTMKCYMLSMLPVTNIQFLLTNLLSGIPYSVFWGYIGSESKDIEKLFSSENKGNRIKIVIMVAGISFGILALVAIGYFTKKKLIEIQKLTETKTSSIQDIVQPTTPLPHTICESINDIS